MEYTWFVEPDSRPMKHQEARKWAADSPPSTQARHHGKMKARRWLPKTVYLPKPINVIFKASKPTGWTKSSTLDGIIWHQIAHQCQQWNSASTCEQPLLFVLQNTCTHFNVEIQIIQITNPLAKLTYWQLREGLYLQASNIKHSFHNLLVLCTVLLHSLHRQIHGPSRALQKCHVHRMHSTPAFEQAEKIREELDEIQLSKF